MTKKFFASHHFHHFYPNPELPAFFHSIVNSSLFPRICWYFSDKRGCFRSGNSTHQSKIVPTSNWVFFLPVSRISRWNDMPKKGKKCHWGNSILCWAIELLISMPRAFQISSYLSWSNEGPNPACLWSGRIIMSKCLILYCSLSTHNRKFRPNEK